MNRLRRICVLGILFFSFLSLLINSDIQAQSSDLSPAEQEIVREINLARSNPSGYVAHLEQLRASYVGNQFRLQGRPAIVTNEGVAALEDAIRQLRAMNPLPPFEISRGLTSAARDHARDIGQRNMRGHRGSDGSIPNDRANRYGTFTGGIGECIEYQNDSARETVIKWLIDDGVASRGHRNSILSSNYRNVGVAIGDCSNGGQMAVLTLVGGYSERTLTAPRSVGSAGNSPITARPVTARPVQRLRQ
jgi:uncharacterized protein YkwD